MGAKDKLLNVARKGWFFSQDNFSGTYLAISADKAVKERQNP